jgi:hypothetical protein
MRTVRRGFVVAIALSTVAFTSTAMAGKNGVPGANQNAPGQVFKSERNAPSAVPGGSALSPGQDFKARKSLDPLASSPGQQFKSLGTPSEPIPGSLP